MIRLRDMIESDIEDYVRWFTVDTEWGDWDAPWESFEATPDEERASWTSYFHMVQALPADVVRQKFEIECDGVHIGWVSRYTDLDYMDNPGKLPAIGIDLPERSARGRGAGTEALRQFIAYLHDNDCPAVYTQTWSGNLPMLRVAEKLGFREVCRKVGLREVHGEEYDAITLRLDL